MNGKILVGGLLLISVIFGIGLWYSQNTAYYRDVTTSEVVAFGDPYPVSDYRGIDADTSPLKMRGCFQVDWDYAQNDAYQNEAEPLVAPSWFDCFDAEQISHDIKSGAATAILAELNQPFGFSRFIAQYPDGRAFMWRRLNQCGAAYFSGDPLPDGCGENSTDLGTSSGLIAPEPSVVAIPPDPVQQDVAVLPAPQEETHKLVEPTPTTDIVASVQPVRTAEPTDTAPLPAIAPTAAPVVLAHLQNLTETITLVPLIGAVPEEIDATGLKARADASLPFSFHGCFATSYSFGLLTETFEVADPAEAPQITGALTCFDAEQLNEDLKVGNAIAFWGVRNIKPGVDRVVAIYNDGKAFVWQQKNENYAE